MTAAAIASPGVDRRNPGRRRARRWAVPLSLLALTALALGLRIYLRFALGILFFGDPHSSLPLSDAETWNIHALNWLAGRGFGDVIHGVRHENFVPPGHPLFLALIYFFAGNRPDVAGWVIALLGALLPVVTYFMVRDMWGRAAGLWAALLAAVYQPYVALGFSTMSEPTSIFFTAVALGQWVRWVRRPSLSRALLAGSCFALAGLMRPVALAFLFGLAPFTLAVRGPLWRRAACLAALALPLALATGGWELRNRLVFRTAEAPFTWNTAIHRWIGAHPQYGPFFYTRTYWHRVIWRDPAASEGEMLARMQRESAGFIRADPLRWYFGALWRFGLMEWRPHEKPLPLHISFRGVAGISILFVVAALGWLQGFRLRTSHRGPGGPSSRVPGGFWCGALGSAFAAGLAATILFGGSERYRWPLDYLLLPFVALALDRLARIGRDDYAAVGTVRCAVPRAAWPVRIAGALLAAVFVALGVAFNLGLARAYAHPDRSAETAPRRSAETVHECLERMGLADDWKAQGARWITFSDVHAEQAANGGYVTSLADAVVAWWGRILYVRTGKRGEVAGLELVERPRTGDFGGARVDVSFDAHTEWSAGEIREGRIVTVIGRLAYTHEDEPKPRLRACAVLPGRFDPPPVTPGQPAAPGH